VSAGDGEIANFARVLEQLVTAKKQPQKSSGSGSDMRRQAGMMGGGLAGGKRERGIHRFQGRDRRGESGFF
jgi:hypothetical protein